MKTSFSIKEALREGWNTFKERPCFLIGALLLITIVAGIMGFVVEQFSGSAYIAVNILDFAFQTVMGMGLTYITLAVYDKKSVGYGDWFAPMSLFFKYLAATILVMIAVVLGLILFIIPGIILGIGLMFTTYLIIDKNLGPIDAMKKSWHISKGYKWKLFLFTIVTIIVNILGALALLVGLLVTIPVTFMATIHIYRILLKNNSQTTQIKENE